MRNVLTIAGRELRSYFSSPVAYVLLAAFLALAGYFFFALLSAFNQTLQMYSMMRNPEMLSRFNLNQMVVVPLLHNMSVLLIFIVPAISMRMFPEEKRAGTYELLLTSPVRISEIVFGKFLGGLAQALIHDPPVLILDEPTIGLDPRQIIEIRSLIKTLGGKRTVVLSTHILPEVSQVCDKVVIINDGRIVVEDELANLTRGRTLEDVFIEAISRDTGDGARAAAAET